jgi:KaiC/GvpD/RAD55 family RecA-like ATPase
MVDMNIRCPTGIPGLDELIEGGFPRQRSILVSGTCGSGKTTLAVQFLYRGITDYNEPGVLISLEQDPKELKKDMSRYGFNLEKAENEGKLVIVDASLSRVTPSNPETPSIRSSNFAELEGSRSVLPDEFNIDSIMDIVAKSAKKIGAKRAVFDSLPALDFLIGGKTETEMKHAIRQTLVAINSRLKNADLTTIMITETGDESPASAHGVESYVADGSIILTVNETLDNRTIKIKKMRQTKHTLKPNAIDFTEKGMAIKGSEKRLF